MSAFAIYQHVEFRQNHPMAHSRQKNRIEAARLAKGWSMAKLGAACRPPASASQINKLEKGHVKLTTEWLRILGAALGVHPNDLTDTPVLTPHEAALVELYRGLSESDREAVFRIAGAFTQPADPAKRKTQTNG